MAKINGDKLSSFTIISNEELNKLVKVKATTGELQLLILSYQLENLLSITNILRQVKEKYIIQKLVHMLYLILKSR